VPCGKRDGSPRPYSKFRSDKIAFFFFHLLFLLYISSISIFSFSLYFLFSFLCESSSTAALFSAPVLGSCTGRFTPQIEEMRNTGCGKKTSPISNGSYKQIKKDTEKIL
jgi:hypothetical protein